MGNDALVPRVPGIYWSTGEQVGYEEEGYLQFDTWMILNTSKKKYVMDTVRDFDVSWDAYFSDTGIIL